VGPLAPVQSGASHWSRAAKRRSSSYCVGVPCGVSTLPLGVLTSSRVSAPPAEGGSRLAVLHLALASSFSSIRMEARHGVKRQREAFVPAFGSQQSSLDDSAVASAEESVECVSVVPSQGSVAEIPAEPAVAEESPAVRMSGRDFLASKGIVEDRDLACLWSDAHDIKQWLINYDGSHLFVEVFAMWKNARANASASYARPSVAVQVPRPCIVSSAAVGKRGIGKKRLLQRLWGQPIGVMPPLSVSARSLCAGVWFAAVVAGRFRRWRAARA